MAHGLWRDRNFLRLWAGETVSQTGSRVTMLALPLVAVVSLDATPVQMGLLGAMGAIPALFVGLLAGVWVDRVRRRPLMIAADLGRCLLLLLIPLAHLLDMLRIELLYGVALFTGALSLLYSTAYRSYLPSLIGRDDLIEGNSRLEVSQSAAEIAGPGLAGGLIHVLGASFALVADALSFLASAGLIGSITHAETAPQARTARTSVWTEARAGLRLVVRNPTLRALAATGATISLFNAMFEAVLLLYLTRTLQLSPLAIGLIFAGGSVGFLMGAMLPGRIVRQIGVGPSLVVAIALAASSDIIVPLAGGPRAVVIGLLVLAQCCFGVGLTIYGVNQVSLRQAVTPDELLGRMNATMQFAGWVVIPLAALAGGLLGSVIGLRPTLLLAALGELCAVGWVIASPIWQMQQHPTSPSVQPM